MKNVSMLLVAVFIVVSLTGTAFAQIDITKILPVYPDAKVDTISTNGGDRVELVTSDDTKAVMIFFRKMLAYKGWRVSSGSVLNSDPIIEFARNGHRLTMASNTSDEKTTRIIFSIIK